MDRLCLQSSWERVDGVRAFTKSWNRFLTNIDLDLKVMASSGVSNSKPGSQHNAIFTRNQT